jgi:glycosyltransferase involved in cell wall biosynthesis
LNLSVVIITFNEEKNIERCIDSVQGLADEILVVDSFSTDATKQICLNKKVRFIEHRFEGHIEQKNWAAEQARFSFVLSLDADEALSKELYEEIKNVKVNPLFDGYSMNRLTNYCGKWIRHCGWYPDKKMRLWKKGKGQWNGTNPHDKFELFEGSKGGYLGGDILHHSYYNLNDHIKQIHYFTDIASKVAYNQGKRSSYVKVVFHPFVKFNRDYFFKLGILDGFEGFLISLISAFATFLKYAKLLEYQKKTK